MSAVEKCLAPGRLLFLGISIILTILAVLTFLWFWFFLDRPLDAPTETMVELAIPRGTGIQEVANSIEDLGLIRNSQYFVWRYRIGSRLGILDSFQAGRYFISDGLRPSDVMLHITSPHYIQRVYTEFTIPPGTSSSLLAQIVESNGLALAVDVEKALMELAVEYPILQTEKGLQGYLFPDTYKIEKPLEDGWSNSSSTAQSIVRIMADTFFSVLDKTVPTWKKLTKTQLHEKVILASIVEREYRVEEEAALIAGVFHNRLTESIPLESCATVVYVIEETMEGQPFREEYVRFNRRIFEQYLDIDSPYNTYRRRDLPPSPIAFPGHIALEAAFFPALTDALFFVVKNPSEGTHVFTRTYSDHLNARADYLNQYVVKE